ncbi:helix-turn-helix transcriptional regulator [Oceanobacter mangrovi]|uniref:helix-turn-helix transcriptional regulator n=1 Tax=Oceanobacter mangrovi TaxID=2862510 RepID=UPI001C8D8721|nr:helix-turn-helix domain-containing protein [Oceanobacter mangrovi]
MSRNLPSPDNNSVLQTYQQLQQLGYGQPTPSHNARYYERPLQNTSISLCLASPLTSIRTPAIAAALPADYCSVVLISHGLGYWINDAHIHRLDQGCALLMNASTPFAFHFPGHYSALSFNFPAHLSPWDPQQPGAPLHGSRLQLSRAQASHLRRLMTLALNHPRKQDIEHLLFRLLSQLANAQPERMQQLKQQIQQQLRLRGDCDVESLQTATGWSRRYLFKLFEQQQYSLSQYIQLQKLGQGFGRLTTQQHSHLSINDIALDAGFASQAHFARQFRQHFGITPTQLRQQLQQTLAENWAAQLG